MLVYDISERYLLSQARAKSVILSVFIQIKKKKTREDEKWYEVRPQVVNAPSWTKGFLYLRGNYVPHKSVLKCN